LSDQIKIELPNYLSGQVGSISDLSQLHFLKFGQIIEKILIPKI
jgi:hypothetical protein